MLLLLLSCTTGPDDARDTAAPADARACLAPAPAPPACGTGPVDRGAALPGPGQDGHDAALAAGVLARDRAAVAVTAWATGATCEVSVADPDDQARVAAFLADPAAGWDLEAATGLPPTDIVDQWWKAAGAYAGVAIAADAFRYATLRDEGADCADVEQARARLQVSLDTLHMAQAITGAEGTIARGFARKDLPGGGEVETTPLFDEAGAPLPAEKDNGTWREDASGLYPDMVWEDSCSRDQYVGWIAGMAAAWEAIRDDDAFAEADKASLQADAEALARSLMVVRESGYDLEIRDADGRTTYHGLLHEESIDRVYVPGARNGQNAVMVLGIVGALAFVAEEPEIDAWLADTLIAERDIPGIARDNLASLIDLGTSTNFSNYNMAFLGGWLAGRYTCDDDARAAANEGIRALYARPDEDRQPIEQEQALYDLVDAFAVGGATAWASGEAAPDAAALAKMARVLGDVRPAPFWDVAVENCDADEVAAGVCTLLDGTVVTLWEGLEDATAVEPVPMAVRPSSNYYWRSNPYEVNGTGSGTTLYPNVDVRFVYWAARWARP